MNANELADYLEDCGVYSHQDIRNAVDTLRQQQAEIERLKAENKFFKDIMGDVEILRKAQEK
jgi:hypothetical protein